MRSGRNGAGAKAGGAGAPVRAMGPLEWAMLLALSALWGGSFFFVEIILAAVPPFTLVFLRVSLAALILWAVLVASGIGLPKSGRLWGAFFVIGLLNNAVPFSLFVWGQTEISASLASVINAMTPLFAVAVAGALLPDEPMTRLKALGAVAGLAGVAVMTGTDLALGGWTGEVWGQVAVLGTALSYALAGVYARRFARAGVAPLQVAAGQTTTASLWLLPWVFLWDGPAALSALSASAGIWAAILALAGFSTAFAYILYFRIVASAGAVNVVLVTFLAPPVTILLGGVFLAERLGLRHFAGLALIGLGLSLIDGRLWRRKEERGD